MTNSHAPQPAQIAHEESSIGSLIDVDSPHVSSVTSDYSGETDTQVSRKEREAKEAEQKAKDKFAELEGETAKKYEKAKGYAKEKGKKAEASTKKGGQKLSDNRTNPVVVGNAIVLGVGSAVLGYGAYQKYAKGQLDWKLAGTWAGIVGLFATGDYFLSKFLFEKKFPPK